MSNKENCNYTVASEFSRFPGGRLRSHGPKSGEEFRDDVLIELYNSCNKLTINLTGAVGYGSSFLDESFGELGKIYGIDAVKDKLTLVADDDPNLISIVWDKVSKGSEERNS